MPPFVLVCLIIFLGVPLAAIFSIPIALILTHHRRKMEELSLRKQAVVAETIRAEFASVRAEIQALRDTTMQYDLSFDTTLQQMDQRMTHLERTVRNQTLGEAPQNLIMGGR
jgi:hypothetical protein